MLTTSKMLNRGWAGFTKNLGFLIALCFLSVLAVFPIHLLLAMISEYGARQQWQNQDGSWQVLALVANLAQIIPGTLMSIGWINVCLKIARGKRPLFSDFFSKFGRILPAVGASSLISIGTYFGLLLCVVPGVIFFLMTFYSLWFVVDKNLGALGAIRASMKLTKGYKGQLFGFCFLSFLISIGVMTITCGFGFLLMGPMLGVAMASGFVDLTGSGSSQGRDKAKERVEKQFTYKGQSEKKKAGAPASQQGQSTGLESDNLDAEGLVDDSLRLDGGQDAGSGAEEPGGSDLAGVDMRSETLVNAELPHSNMSEANLTGVDLEGANLQGSVLVHTGFRGANLTNANLRDSNLQRAVLYLATLSGADLQGANLEEANLQEANLASANLSGASLAGANVVGVDFRGAVGVVLKGAIGTPAHLPADPPDPPPPPGS